MIDFSKSPEGATHYGLDSHSVSYFLKINSRYFYDNDGLWIDSPYHHHDWLKPIQKTTNGEKMNIEINMNNMIECKTDREKMLCEQVLRMCRGEESQIKHKGYGDWNDIRDNPVCLSIEEEYRAKPKKELVVPWKWLPDEVTDITVCENLHIYNNLGNTVLLKLDLEDIDLPVTVIRPKEE